MPFPLLAAAAPVVGRVATAVLPAVGRAVGGKVTNTLVSKGVGEATATRVAGLAENATNTLGKAVINRAATTFTGSGSSPSTPTTTTYEPRRENFDQGYNSAQSSGSNSPLNPLVSS